MAIDKKISYRVLPIRIEEENYRALRKLAYLKEISMAEIIRQLIENKVKKGVD